MIALSVRQPWAWLIVNGYKDVENRTWSTKCRGEILIHAGKTFDLQGYCWVYQNIDVKLPSRSSFYRGGIVGKVTITDCVTELDSEWFVGPFGFVLKDACTIPFYEIPGRLSFFEVSKEAI